MKPTVFIETTIPSFYFETRKQVRIEEWRTLTRRWWDLQRYRFRLVTSTSVILEIAATPGDKGMAMRTLMEDVEVLDTRPRHAEIVAEYLRNKVMPADSEGDAAHLAAASLAACDFLLTWNCLHLANSNKLRHIQTVNDRLDLKTPVLCTPAMLV